MTINDYSSDGHELRGPIDRPALIRIRDTFTKHEPLSSARLDDLVSPSVLVVEFTDGIGDAESTRIDIRWTMKGDYSFHYTDSEGINARWGNHPHHGDYPIPGTEHFHPPPDATSDPLRVEASCFSHTSERLVTLAVIELWRTAYHNESPGALNAGENPP